MVYFIQDSVTLHIKIGYAADPEERLKALQTGNPSDLVLLASMPGEQSLERQFHRDFAEFRISGEWFRPAPAIIRTIFRCWVDLTQAAQLHRENQDLRELISKLDDKIQQLGSLVVYLDDQNRLLLHRKPMPMPILEPFPEHERNPA